MTYEFDNEINRIGPANEEFLPFLQMVLEKSLERDSLLGQKSDKPVKRQGESSGQYRGLMSAES
jgi:hypothetical protein